MSNDCNDIISKISSNQSMRFLNSKELYLEKDIITTSSMIFNTENALKMGCKIRYISIPISEETSRQCDLDAIAYELENLLTNVLIEDIKIKFDIQQLTKHRRSKQYNPIESESVCLFSGGVDSFSGILNTSFNFGPLWGVSIVHGDQAWGSKIVNDLIEVINPPSKIHWKILYGPKMRSLGYSQLRGFLYMLYGSIYVNMAQAKRLVVTEVGPTMYQPRFSPFDSVTMTTHPFVLSKAKNVIELFLNKKCDIILPYENLTKSEVISISPNKDQFKNTHSCISLRFGHNEGVCYGCIIRRLGFIVAGSEDCQYKHNPFEIGSTRIDNLASVLAFSQNVLFNYDKMNFSSKENIMKFDKLELFQRFALDNFAAIHLLLKSNGEINRIIQNLYLETVDRLGDSILEDRISDVRNKKYKPNFNTMVPDEYSVNI